MPTWVETEFYSFPARASTWINLDEAIRIDTFEGDNIAAQVAVYLKDGTKVITRDERAVGLVKEYLSNQAGDRARTQAR
jgi:hypothetical protein